MVDTSIEYAGVHLPAVDTDVAAYYNLKTGTGTVFALLPEGDGSVGAAVPLAKNQDSDIVRRLMVLFTELRDAQPVTESDRIEA